MVLSLFSNARKFSCSISFNQSLTQLTSSNFSFWDFTLSSFMNDIFTGYWILGQRFKDLTPLSAASFVSLGESLKAIAFWLASLILFSGCLYNLSLSLFLAVLPWYFGFWFAFVLFCFFLPFCLLLVIFLLRAWVFLPKPQKLGLEHCMTI